MVIIKESIDSGEDTDSFIRGVADFLIDSQGLREQVGQVIIENERAPGSKVKGTMGKDGHNLFFYRKGLEHAYENYAEGIPDLFDEDEKKVIKYLSYAKVIIHELEHLKQAVDVKDENKTDLKSLVLKLCDRENGISAQIGYKVMRKLHPTERFADIVAYDSIISICDALGDKYDRVSALFELFNLTGYIDGYLTSFEEGYDSKNGPTYFCMKEFTKKEQFEEFERLLMSSDLSFDERVFLGVNLSQEEIDSIAKHHTELVTTLKSTGSRPASQTTVETTSKTIK